MKILMKQSQCNVDIISQRYLVLLLTVNMRPKHRTTIYVVLQLSIVLILCILKVIIINIDNSLLSMDK